MGVAGSAAQGGKGARLLRDFREESKKLRLSAAPSASGRLPVGLPARKALPAAQLPSDRPSKLECGRYGCRLPGSSCGGDALVSVRCAPQPSHRVRAAQGRVFVTGRTEVSPDVQMMCAALRLAAAPA